MRGSIVAPLSPMRVHEHACQLLGHRPYWQRAEYRGGIYWTEHFRTCSYCGCIHPADLIELLGLGGRLEPANKPGKFYLFTPNPVAGDFVHMGTVPGRTFGRDHEPQDLIHRLYDPPSAELRFEATIGERLSGHFERPALEPAPAEIKWPFYTEHANEQLWADICAAANHGAKP